MDILSNPVVVAVLALIAVPAIASVITALLRKLVDDGVKPQAVLYIVSAVVVALAMVTAGAKLPSVDPGNPLASIAEWQTLAAGLTLYTGVLYDVLLKRFWPGPVPEPAPAPTTPFADKSRPL
jgi:hypothetical protein